MLRSYLIDGVLAGAMVSVGGAVLLSCDNRYLGAFLFCIALLSICWFGFNLYTGKVGFLYRDHSRAALAEAFCGLLGNALGTLFFGALIALALPQLRDAALAACEKRLTQLPLQTLLRGCFCGLLMYTAVWVYREKKTPLGILFCIPVFILSGFEHSVADMFYFAAAGVFSLQAVLFIVIVAAGNAVGALLLDRILFFAGLKKGA